MTPALTWGVKRHWDTKLYTTTHITKGEATSQLGGKRQPLLINTQVHLHGSIKTNDDWSCVVYAPERINRKGEFVGLRAYLINFSNLEKL